MIYIKKSIDNQFFADVENSKNKENLTVTETHTQKHNAWKNLFAIAKEFHSEYFLVNDTTVKGGKNYWCANGKKFMKPLNT